MKILVNDKEVIEKLYNDNLTLKAELNTLKEFFYSI